MTASKSKQARPPTKGKFGDPSKPQVEGEVMIGRRPFVKLLSMLTVTAAGAQVSGVSLRDLAQLASASRKEDLQKGLDDFATSYMNALQSANAGLFVSRRSIAIVMNAIDLARGSVKILGINALGPLHQGREKLLKILDGGGQVSVGMMDPFGSAFSKRQDDEGRLLRGGKLSTRLAFEWVASFGILRDLDAFREDRGELDVWLYDEYPRGSIVIVDHKLAQYNPYEREPVGTTAQKAWMPRGVTRPLHLFSKEAAPTEVERLCTEFDRLRRSGVAADMSRPSLAMDVLRQVGLADA